MFRIGSYLLLVTRDFSLELDIFPTEFDWLSASLFCRLDELNWVNVGSSGQRHSSDTHSFGVLGLNFIEISREGDVTCWGHKSSIQTVGFLLLVLTVKERLFLKNLVLVVVH